MRCNHMFLSVALELRGGRITPVDNSRAIDEIDWSPLHDCSSRHIRGPTIMNPFAHTDSPPRARTAALLTFVIVALIIVPSALTLMTVKHPGTLVVDSDNPTPLGYTVSLLLFIAPLAYLAWWFLRQTQLRFPKTAFWWTIGLLVPSGIVLDVLFATTFFTFNNAQAVAGAYVPVLGGEVPIEEFVFYLSGFALVLLLYIWGDEYWLRAYNVSSYEEASRTIQRIVRFHPASLLWGIGLIVAATVYKNWFGSSEEGMPWYFIYLVVVAIVPSVGFFETAKSFINWRALSFTIFPILLISLLWEATLALPYQWWGYQRNVMVGIFIGPWSNLPVEAVCVWIAVTFTTVVTYEVIKVWKATGRRARDAFFGARTPTGKQ